MSLQMERWLEMQNPTLQKSVTPVEVDGQLLHLSREHNIKKFTPRIPHSLYDGEDQTVPRISVSRNLIDTIVGASWNFEQLFESVSYDVANYAVYGLTTDAAIRPTKKLTKELLATGELWVVPHKLSMYEIVPERLAFLSLRTVTNIDGCVSLDFVIDVQTPIMLTDAKRLEVGYYTLADLNLKCILGKRRDLSYSLSAITRDVFLAGKQTLNVVQ